MLYKNHGCKKTAYCLAFQNKTLIYLKDSAALKNISLMNQVKANKSISYI